MTTALALPLLFLICGGICHYIAKKRHAKVSFWLVMGALFGPLAIPFAFFARPQKTA